MDEMPSRVAARRQLQKAQRAAIINGAGQGGSHLLLLLRWTVLYGRLQLALVGGSLAASVLLIFAGSYLQFTSSSSSSSLSSKTSSSASELHHPQQLNTTSLISGLLAIDLEAFRARRALFNKAGEEEEEDFAESSSVLIFVGATSATVELLLLLAILLEHFKGSLAISLLLGGSYLWYMVTSWSTSTSNSAASAASATFQLALLLASLLYTATIKVKVRLADRVLLLQQKSVDKDEMRLEEMRRRRRNNA